MRFIPEASTKIDTIKRIKQRTIAGVYCHKMDEELGFHEPYGALLVFGPHYGFARTTAA